MTDETYVVVDTETSGLFDYTKPADADGQPRMAAFAMLLLAPDFSVANEQSFLVKPDGWEMNATATAIHGLTQEKLLAEGVAVADVLAKYVEALKSNFVVVGYNVSYDLKVLRGELRRAALPDMFETTRSIDCMRPLTDICKIPKAKGNGFKLPKLKEAYQSIFTKELVGAHGALADARACAEIFKEMMPRGIFKPLLEQAGSPS